MRCAVVGWPRSFIRHLRNRILSSSGTSMTSKRSRRKPDLFSLLLIIVVVGMAATLAYQINVYYGADAVPIARQGPTVGAVGG